MVTQGEGPYFIGVYENLKDDLNSLDKKENVTSKETTLTFLGRKTCILYVRNESEGTIKSLRYQ